MKMNKKLIFILITILITISGCISSEDAIKNQQLKICKEDPNPDSCYYNVATWSNDTEICNIIENDNYRYQCLGELKLDLSYCAMIDSSDIAINNKGGCYSKIAIETEDYSICEIDSKSEVKELCGFRAISSKSPSICENVENLEVADMCYYTAALSEKDTSLCDNIQKTVSDVQTRGDRDWCYWQIAISTKDSSLCEDIQIQTTRDNCFFNVATMEQDTSICAKIEDQSEKRSCLELAQPQ